MYILLLFLINKCVSHFIEHSQLEGVGRIFSNQGLKGTVVNQAYHSVDEGLFVFFNMKSDLYPNQELDQLLQPSPLL